MGDRHLVAFFLLVLASELPDQPAVDGGKGVVDGHGSIAVETVRIIKDDVERWHDDTHEPQEDAGPVL